MPPILGVIGGGQLARMMIPAAIELGVDIRVLAENEGESAAIAVGQLGNYRNLNEVLRFANTVDVITFDHEHVPQAVLRGLVDAGVAVHPSPDALRFAQNKILMRERLTELGVPVPDWARISSPAELATFLEEHGGKAVLKTPEGGYDGKGVRLVTSVDDAADWLETGEELLAEEVVEFRRELAQLIARRPSGQSALWPVVETVQRNGVCAEVLAPAPHASGKLVELAQTIAATIADGLGVTGVLAVELFETTDDRLLVNELAMRPHNSGHWSMDGAVTGQFEQHVRAVLDLPLGATDPLEKWSVMVNVLGGPASGSLFDRYGGLLSAHPSVKVHNYGKTPRPGRKVGHVTAGGSELDEVVYSARAAAAFFDD